MQTLLKYRWAVAVSLAFTIIFGGLFIGTPPASADGYGGIVNACTYTFTSSKQVSIKRSDCPTGYQALVYKQLPQNRLAYVQTSSKANCAQTITLDSAGGDDDSVKGYLSGQHESNGSCESIDPPSIDQTAGWGVTVVKAGAGAVQSSDTEIAASAAQSTVYGKLEDLIDKRCKNDTSGYCDKQYLDAVYDCTAKALDKIDDSDKKKDEKFRDAFTPCLTNATKGYLKGGPTDITAKKINSALGDNIYSEMKTAGEAAVAGKGAAGDGSDTADSVDTCNASGNPVSWILCPVYDGLGSLSDALLDNVLVGFLKSQPVSTDPDNPMYQIWSSFRVWGDILLVIGLLVVVFGQAIGGGLVDAYTAKKVLPRLLVAAILINLSIYIVAFAVDISNIIGAGISNIINAPLDGVKTSPTDIQLGLFAGLAAVAGAGVTIMGALAFIFGVSGVIGGFAPFLLLFVILPVLLSIIFIFCILVLRQGIIVALVLVSPVAFALYCLPNTEQYFRKWWGLLVNMLMVYPIVMVIFSVANVLAYTTIKAAADDGGGSFWAYLVAFLLQFLPLFMIPYAFKLAGGVLGRIHDIAVGQGKRGVEGLKGNPNDPWSRRNRYAQKSSNKFLEGRENLVGRGKDLQKGGAVSSFMGRRISGVAGLGNYEDLRSRRNKAASEMLQSHIATGGDSTVRALFAQQNGQGEWVGTNGTTKFAESDVQKARSLYGSDPSMFQAAYSYELGKAANDVELAETQRRGVAVMNDRRLPDKGGVTLGAHWNHQQTRRELKHTKLQSDDSFIRTANAFTQEVAENVSGYALSNMRTSTIKALSDDYVEAGTALKYHQNPQSQDADVVALRGKVGQNAKYLEARGLDTTQKAADVQRFVKATADSLQARALSSGTYGLAGDDHETPVSGAQSGGPGLVSQEIDRLIAVAGSPVPQRPQRPPDPPAQGPQGPTIIIPPRGYTGGQG